MRSASSSATVPASASSACVPSTCGVSGTGAMLWDPDEEWRDAERTIDEVTARVRARGRAARHARRSARQIAVESSRARDPDDDDAAELAVGESR